MQNHPWELIDLPLGNKPQAYKWIFKKKKDGSVDKYKTKLVAKGYRQKGLDFFNTYTAMTKITLMRVLITIDHYITMKFIKWS